MESLALGIVIVSPLLLVVVPALGFFLYKALGLGRVSLIGIPIPFRWIYGWLCVLTGLGLANLVMCITLLSYYTRKPE